MFFVICNIIILLVVIQCNNAQLPSSQDITYHATSPSSSISIQEPTILTTIALKKDGDVAAPYLNLVMGVDLESQIDYYGSVLGDGLAAASRSMLLEHARNLALEQGQTFRHKVAIVVFSIDDLRGNEEEGGTSSLAAAIPLEATVSAALTSTLMTTGGGHHFIIATSGFSLCQQAAASLADLVVRLHGWGAFTALHVEESEGLSSAINHAMSLIDHATIMAVFTPSFCGPLPVPAPTNATASSSKEGQQQRDIYVAYEQMGQSPLLLTASPPTRGAQHDDKDGDPSSYSGCWPGLHVPLLVFDDDTYRRLGPLDGGYMYQGGIAEWIQRASYLGYHQDQSTVLPDLLLLEDIEGNDKNRQCHGGLFTTPLQDPKGPYEAFGGWVSSIDSISPASAEGMEVLERLYQKDMDHFYLQQAWRGAGPCRRAEGGQCVEEGGKGGGLSQEDRAFHRSWSGRSISPELVVSEEGVGWRDRLRVAAVLCVYDDTRFLKELVMDLTAQVDHVMVLVSAIPWQGDVREGENRHTMQILAELMADRRLHRDRLSVIKGRWSSEGEQRQYGNTLVKSMPGNFTHVMVVDGDEFWHPVELELALNLVAHQHTPPAVPFAAAKMWTYWKSLRVLIYPPEDLNILWLVDPWQCDFTVNREVTCQGGILVLGLAKCHHLSYVRTTQELTERKLASFSHANEVYAEWFQEKWLGWDMDNSIRDLHPTQPTAYRTTRSQPLYLLAPTLRRLHLFHRKHSSEGKQQQQQVKEKEEVRKMMTYVSPRCDLGQNCSCQILLAGSCGLAPSIATEEGTERTAK